MRTSQLLRLALCFALATPAVVIRFSGIAIDPVAGILVFGAAIVAASFLLAWAAEAAQVDISGRLAIAILALIAVLPEYAVDLFYAFRSGSEPLYEQFAAANRTGSNRLLLGFGWPLVVLVALAVYTRRARVRREPRPPFLALPAGSRLDIGVLAVLAVVALLIPLMGMIPVWFGLVLIAFFVFYLWRAGQAGEDDGGHELVGMAAHLAALPRRPRRIAVTALFVLSAAIILAAAEPFAESLVGAGSRLGVDPYFLVQWLAPLASEAPEFIIAVLFALRGHGAAAIGTLIASKINQWSLLVGSLPIAHLVGGGGFDLALDGRQVEEFVLTATQTILGVAIIIALRFHRSTAIALAALFAVQFVITGTTGRWILSAIQVLLAAGILVINRGGIVPTLLAPWRRAAVPGTEPVERERQPVA